MSFANHVKPAITAFRKGLTIAYFADRYIEESDDVIGYVIRRDKVFEKEFCFNFNQLTKLKCLMNFRFRKRSIYRLIPGILWPAWKIHTKQNRYGFLQSSPHVCNCVAWRHQYCGKLWLISLESGPHKSPKSSGNSLNFCSKLVCTWSPILFTKILYGTELKRMQKGFTTSPGDLRMFSDSWMGTCNCKTDRAHAATRCLQVVYNGHNRKHALNYHAVGAPDRLMCISPDWSKGKSTITRCTLKRI